MLRLLAKFGLIGLLAAAYIAWPFATAWSIREAVRNGDSAYLQDRIDWPSVRVTLAPSVRDMVLSAPQDASQTADNASLWQRFKSYMGEGAINQAVDSYVTPEGLTQLFKLRKAYRDYIAGAPDESKLSLQERIGRAWARVKRAEFTSVTTFEVDMVDKFDETRLYLGKLELTGFGWILRELRVKSLVAAEAGPMNLAFRVADPSAVWDGLRTPRGDR